MRRKLPKANVIAASLLVTTAMFGSTSAYASINTHTPSRVNIANGPLVKAKAIANNAVEYKSAKNAFLHTTTTIFLSFIGEKYSISIPKFSKNSRLSL